MTYSLEQLTLPVGAMEIFDEKLAKLNKTAKKLGVQEVTYEIVGEEYKEQHGAKIKCNILKITQLEEIKVNGFTVVAKLERNTGSSFIVKSYEEIPQELRQPHICEHCHTNRRRNYYYILKDEQGKYITVGKSCLKDFLGHTSAEAIARYIETVYEYLNEVSYDEEKYPIGGSWGGEFYYDIEQVLKYAIYSVKKYGFKPTGGYGLSTRQSVCNMMWDNYKDWVDDKKEADETITEEEVKEVMETILNAEATSDFMQNLKILINDKMVKVSMFGYVASMPRTAEKIKGTAPKFEKKEKLVSNFIGTEGEKIEVVATYKKEIIFDGFYGTTSMHFFEDEKGNIIIWKTGTMKDFEKGQSYNINATVKEHNEYNGTKQTFVIRPKIKERS